MTTLTRSYHVEPNEDPLTRGTFPWIVTCPDDGWFLRCRKYETAMARAAMLNTVDTAPVSISAKPMEARS
jgi:hypothetical protein